MKKLNNLEKKTFILKRKLRTFVKMSVVFTVLSLALIGCKQEDALDLNDISETNTEESQVESTKNGSLIYVYIYGEVKNPGVYEVEEGSRLFEVLDKAGGYTKKAAEYLNLAREVTDGEEIKVLSKSEYSNSQKENSNVDADINDTNTTGQENSDSGESQGTKVNINSASVSQLMELPGIGEIKAQAIVAYREENGKFTSIEDIKNVSGIKDAAFSKIKDLIQV